MSDDTEKLPTDKPTLLQSAQTPPPDLDGEPPVMERDLALGRFMDAWSQLEASLRKLLRVLSQAPEESAFAIASAIPDLGRMKELLQSLARLYLEIEDQKQLGEILDYLLLSNRYRNSIVHGQWILADNREKTLVRGVEYRLRWTRLYVMPDRLKEAHAALGIDKKAEEQFAFTVKRLLERAQKTKALADRIYAFSESIREKIRKPKSGT